jgi:hypothetical protein
MAKPLVLTGGTRRPPPGLADKLSDLVRLEAILAQTIRRCENDASAPACPVLEMLEAPLPPSA